ncbi:helix-hairpin-helix domain-containing protein [Ruegeria marina]|uniref:Helix-hairpin-helix domain-containing protein n=1 Tax=Ruegeria marina TaxID=639004 RepID=A0A1G6QKL4_9RHOB|nr:helix-hairpin-helix domain-containing protein [Ruegeria marina]SDC92818.1 Helix-hairpin-helix domain-containing protein [Ruegeria marina]
MTSLSDIQGVGPALARLLSEHGYSDAESVAATTVETLMQIPGIGASRAAMIVAAAQALVTPAGGKKPAVSRTPSQRRAPTARAPRAKAARPAPVKPAKPVPVARSETEIALADAAALAEMSDTDAKAGKKAKAAAKEAKAKEKKKKFEEQIKKAKEKVKKKSEKKKKKKKEKKKAKK